MAQMREEMVREHNEAIKAAQQGGLPPQKKPGPKRGSTEPANW